MPVGQECTMRYKARYVLLNYNLIWALILSPFYCRPTAAASVVDDFRGSILSQSTSCPGCTTSGMNPLTLIRESDRQNNDQRQLCVKRYAACCYPFSRQWHKSGSQTDTGLWRMLWMPSVVSQLGSTRHDTRCSLTWALSIRLHLWVPYEYLFHPFPDWFGGLALTGCLLGPEQDWWIYFFITHATRPESGILFYL